MKRGRSSSVVESSQTTTIVKKAKPRTKQSFSVPRWAGRSKTGFPKELRMKHRYCETFNFAGTAGAINNQTFSCNGMYDPNTTGAGHQPMYFDQLSAIYNHYTVLASKITISAVIADTVINPVHLVCYVNDDSTLTPASIQARMEQSTARFTTVLPSGNGRAVLTNRWSATQNFGPGAISDPNLQGDATTNPTEQQFYTISGQVADLVSSWGISGVYVVIEYDAIWQELKDIASS